jgi:two-component system chemotaxis response regulator CheB
MHGAEPELASMLGEWLRAAGFEPIAADPAEPGIAALLGRWPATNDLSLVRAPVVLLVDAAAHVPPTVRARAAEVVVLPDTRDIKSILEWSKLLMSVLRAVTEPSGARALPASPVVAPPDARELRRVAPSLIAIGVSTGGPAALQTFFATLRGVRLPPMAIVQHIPAHFLGVLADRLQQQTGYRTKVAAEGDVLQPGVAYFAPGDRHLRLHHERAQTIARLTDEDPRRGHRPAAEILFESCADLGMRGVGVIMTGMGQDGAQGLLRLRQLGWATVGQDEGTCAIYGMPRAAKQAGAVERELPLADIGPFLTMLCKPRSPFEAGKR